MPPVVFGEPWLWVLLHPNWKLLNLECHTWDFSKWNRVGEIILYGSNISIIQATKQKLNRLEMKEIYRGQVVNWQLSAADKLALTAMPYHKQFFLFSGFVIIYLEISSSYKQILYYKPKMTEIGVFVSKIRAWK